MKRVISIFLLLIMVVVGAHPVLAMHFCEGNLYSVNILDHTTPQVCCEIANSMPQHEDGTCCSGDQATSFGEDNHQEYKLQDDCCDIQKVHLSTDDYQRQDRQFNIGNILPSFYNTWFILSYALVRVELDNTVTLQKVFPPQGLEKQNIDLLTYICIYRI